MTESVVVELKYCYVTLMRDLFAIANFLLSSYVFCMLLSEARP